MNWENISLYRISLLCKKRWYLRVFFYLIDLLFVNAWNEYRQIEANKNTLNLFDFSFSVFKSICMSSVQPKRGRPSLVDNLVTAKRKRGGPKVPMPEHSVRIDTHNHWPTSLLKRGRCKDPSCTVILQTACLKCTVHLCINSKKCFLMFHNISDTIFGQ